MYDRELRFPSGGAIREEGGKENEILEGGSVGGFRTHNRGGQRKLDLSEGKRVGGAMPNREKSGLPGVWGNAEKKSL